MKYLISQRHPPNLAIQRIAFSAWMRMIPPIPERASLAVNDDMSVNALV